MTEKMKKRSPLSKPVTKSEWARYYHVSVQSVCNMVKTGRLPTNGKTGSACRVDLAYTIEMTRGQGVDPTDDDSMESLKKKKLRADTKLAEIKTAEKVEEFKRQGVNDFLDRLTNSLAVARRKFEKQLSSDALSVVCAIIDEVMREVNLNSRPS